MAFPGDEDLEKLRGLLPLEIDGWKPAEPDGRFRRDTLFDLIDGGAEVYRALNVKAVVSRRYGKRGAPDIICDLFDMGRDRDAFGAFHHDMREGESARVGRESEFLGSSLSFWKDRYFVSLTAFDETGAVKKALYRLARSIDRAIPKEGEFPGLVKLLPVKGLDTRQVHYFHDKTLLDRLYFLGGENLLLLGGETEGVLARYMPPAGKDEKKLAPPCALLLVRYPSERVAASAFARFSRAYPGVRRKKGGKGQFGAGLLGNLVAAVLDAPDRREVDRLIEGVRKNRRPSKPQSKEEIDEGEG